MTAHRHSAVAVLLLIVACAALSLAEQQRDADVFGPFSGDSDGFENISPFYIPVEQGDTVFDSVERRLRNTGAGTAFHHMVLSTLVSSKALLDARKVDRQSLGGAARALELRSVEVADGADAVQEWVRDFNAAKRPSIKLTATATNPPMMLAVPDEPMGIWLQRSGLFQQTLAAVFHRVLTKHCKAPRLPGQKRPLVVDVGANLGFFGLMAASYGCRAYLFEAFPYQASFLRLNAYLNNVTDRVKVFERAVSSRSGIGFKLSEDSSFTGFVTEEVPLDEADAISISLDDAIDEDIALIKIDVEGYEFEVLKGMERIFATHRVHNLIMEHQVELGAANEDLRKQEIAWLWQHFERQGATRAVNWMDEYMSRIPPTFSWDPATQCNLVEVDRSWATVSQPEIWFTHDVEEVERLPANKRSPNQKQLPFNLDADTNPECYYGRGSRFRMPYLMDDYKQALGFFEKSTVSPPPVQPDLVNQEL